VSEDGAIDDVLDLLSDEYARAILAATSVEPMSAKTLSERCDASLPTIYRRIERLEEYDLVEEQTKVDPGGSHHSLYSATLSSFEMDLDDGEYAYRIERSEPAFPAEEDAADRLTRMWESL
jgi:DNA-binding transcriptional ArsR family regulator